MDTNEVEAEPAGIAPGATEAEANAPRPSVLRSSWRGAKRGFRWVSYVVGPMAAALLGLSLLFTQFGLATGGVLDLLTLVFGAIGFYVVSVLWGVVIGAVLGLIGGLVRQVWPGAFTFRASWWGAFHRPIHLFGKGRDTAAPVAAARSGFRLWHWLVIVPTLLMLVAALGAGIYLWRIVNRRLTDAIAAADRDDPYWRLDDLMAHREPVPDEENSALIVAEVLALLPADWLSAPKPPPGVPTGSPTELMKAYDRMSATADNVQLDDATADMLRDALETYDEAVKIARTVAGYPRGRHELELGPTLIDTLLPETQASRNVARLLIADAAIRIHDGDPDGALESCRANLCTARSIGDEPFAISQLVRVAIGLVTMQSTRRVLSQGEPSDAALAHLQALILDELGPPLLLYGIRGERATFTELIRRLGTGEVPISALGEGGTKVDPITQRAAISPWGKLWFDQQRAVSLEWMNTAVAIAGRPDAERPQLWQALDAEIVRVKRSRLGIYTATLPLFLMPVLDTSSSAHSRHQCELGATAILLAAERHRRKAGDWPASIAAIAPSILPSTPVDPFSGQAFRMEHRDGQIFIYSIGPNRQDEHGAYDPKRWMKGGPDDAGAVAWDVPLRRQTSPPEEESVRSESTP